MILLLNHEKIKIKIALDYKTRLRGLMGITPIYYGMLFPKCNGIHTFFMKEPIDVIGLNEQNKVIFLTRNLPPNRIVRIPYSIKKTSILELPQNTSSNISLGETLIFKDENII